VEDQAAIAVHDHTEGVDVPPQHLGDREEVLGIGVWSLLPFTHPRRV
jgi:hypothetical protein